MLDRSNSLYPANTDIADDPDEIENMLIFEEDVTSERVNIRTQ